jgi:hypothetical protein
VALGRTRAALLAGVVLATTVPLVASAAAPHLTCGPKQTGRWEQIPVRAFPPVSGLTSKDTVAAFTVDSVRPYDVAATNGARILLSQSNGCDWSNGYALDPLASKTQPFVGQESSIVSLGLLQGAVLAAVQEGGGPSSRPHVLRYDGKGWSTADSGLPGAGAPRLLRAAGDGHTAYLTISPTDSGGSDTGNGGLLPGLPTIPVLPPSTGSPSPGGRPTGLLYATTDAGATWTLRTSANQLPGGGTGFSSLVVDPHNAYSLVGLVAGKAMVSQDGGGSFTALPGSGFTAIIPVLDGYFAAFDGSGHGYLGAGARVFREFAAPKGITSAAYRSGDTSVLVDTGGVLRRLDLSSGSTSRVPTPAAPRPGSLIGDFGVQSSFHALAGHSLLRYVDPPPPRVKNPPVALGDDAVAPPNPGTITPGTTDVSLQLGQSTTKDFTLDLPRNRTPLDLFILVDVSETMQPYIDNLKAGLVKVVRSLQAAQVDLRVGVGTLGTGPAKGEAPYPATYAYAPTVDPSGKVEQGPTYHRPTIYSLVRAMGDTGPGLTRAINSLHLETQAPTPTGSDHREGQLLALDQMITGSGLKNEQEDDGHLPTYSEAAPGQDAHFRNNPGVRRIVVMSTDESFDLPYPTPTLPGSKISDPRLDFAPTLRLLNGAHVGVFGIATDSSDSVPDLRRLASGTHMFAPAGGVTCGGDQLQQLSAGAPLVCSTAGDYSAIIGRVLSALSDYQDVTLQASTQTPVLRSLNALNLRGLDVKRANRASFRVRLSCAGVLPGTYAFDVNAILRQTNVGTTSVRVTCLAPLAALFPVPLAPVPLAPPAAPAVQPPAPPPAPPPAAQPQPNPQPNVNPLTVGVTQEQQELQLALALNQMAQEPEPEQLDQLAMVDRRKREEVQAFGSLLVAMTACAGLGLARLRTRPEVQVRRAR